MTRKIAQIAILLATITITLSILAFSALNNQTVSRHETVITGQTELITWDLKSGQHVEGALNYSLPTFYIVDPNFQRIINATTTDGYGRYSFTAQTTGTYILYSQSIMLQNTIDYNYTVSTPILGVDSTVWIGLVIAVGVILELITILRSIRRRKLAGTK